MPTQVWPAARVEVVNAGPSPVTAIEFCNERPFQSSRTAQQENGVAFRSLNECILQIECSFQTSHVTAPLYIGL
eukprot:scaffold12557_cov75-Cyclotella_meneghiniana.AAC.2